MRRNESSFLIQNNYNLANIRRKVAERGSKWFESEMRIILRHKNEKGQNPSFRVAFLLLSSRESKSLM